MRIETLAAAESQRLMIEAEGRAVVGARRG